MLAISGDDTSEKSTSDRPSQLPFPPVTRQHILNCSFNSWHSKYRTITPKARLIPLSKTFLDYLRADGIILPSETEDERTEWSDTDSQSFSASDNVATGDDLGDEQIDISATWRPIHNAIKTTIADLGGKVIPKLNWSAPKDATWMNANTMECRNPNDVYLLLKSSDFITHDLEHAFDDTVPSSDHDQDTIAYYLVLRKAVTQWNPSVEFRCFVRRRRLLCFCQRDLNHFDFLEKMSARLRSLVQEFFDVRLRDTFPDENFTFDVYVPPPHDRVWLVDINPWALRTDPLLFSWMEILDMPEPPELPKFDEDGTDFVRLSLNDASNALLAHASTEHDNDAGSSSGSSDSSDEDGAEDYWLPELRLVRKSDPEAFSFNSPQYSAHKLPKDVVDAGQSGEGLRQFARDWQSILQKQQQEDHALSDTEDEE